MGLALFNQCFLFVFLISGLVLSVSKSVQSNKCDRPIKVNELLFRNSDVFFITFAVLIIRLFTWVTA